MEHTTPSPLLQKVGDTESSRLLVWTDLLMYYGILVFCATIPFSIGFATGGLFGGAFGWILRCILLRKTTWNRSPLDKVILLFLAVQAISVVFSIDRLRSLDEMRSYWHLLAFFLVVQAHFNDKRLSGATGTLVAAGVLSASMGIGQYLLHYASGDFWGIRSYFLHNVAEGAEGPRVSGAFGMYMTYAGILAMIWAVAVYQAVRKQIKGRQRILYAVATIVISYALSLTLTRTAVLSVLVAGTLLLALRLPRTFLATVVLSLVVFTTVPSLKEKARSVLWGTQSQTMDTNVLVTWGDQRPFLWKGAYRIIKAKPLTGVGLANFRLAYKDYLPYELEKTYHHAHNNFLHLGAETGIPGLVAFVLLVLVSFIALFVWYFRTGPPLRKALIGGVFGAFAGFQIAGLFEYNFGDSEVAMLLWLLLGLAAVAARNFNGVRAD